MRHCLSVYLLWGPGGGACGHSGTPEWNKGAVNAGCAGACWLQVGDKKYPTKLHTDTQLSGKANEHISRNVKTILGTRGAKNVFKPFIHQFIYQAGVDQN